MGDITGFMKKQRVDPKRRPATLRVLDWRDMYERLPTGAMEEQASRCMDCGVPFCQGDTGCPVQNLIPEWNDYVYRGQWAEALTSLHSTNNFPEFTGQLCPAPCEAACVLGIIDEPVSIKEIELSIVNRGFAEGWIKPEPPAHETGHRVAVVGSGPAGLAAAQQLRRMGHGVVVFERDDRIGGLLRYGIPDFKIEKWVVDRRLRQLQEEGVVFRTGVEVGVDLSIDRLRAEFDAVCLAGGAQTPRDLRVPGRELGGIHFAMDFLTRQNRVLAGDEVEDDEMTATGKRVVILGGGDTGSDCLGTCHRQGAASVTQLELLPEPPRDRHASTPWPYWPMKLRTSHAHEEGGARDWSVMTRSFGGSDGRVQRLEAVRVEPQRDEAGRTTFVDVPGSDLAIEADLVLLATGFVGPTAGHLLAEMDVGLDARGNVRIDPAHRTTVEGVFAAGDVHRGASLIVWAIRDGRDAAREIDRYVRRG